ISRLVLLLHNAAARCLLPESERIALVAPDDVKQARVRGTDDMDRRQPMAQSYSALMLAARITFPQVSVYLATKLPKSADELANGSSPKSTSRALNVGSARAALTCLLRIAMISGAVFAGAPSPTQPAAS